MTSIDVSESVSRDSDVQVSSFSFFVFSSCVLLLLNAFQGPDPTLRVGLGTGKAVVYSFYLSHL